MSEGEKQNQDRDQDRDQDQEQDLDSAHVCFDPGADVDASEEEEESDGPATCHLSSDPDPDPESKSSSSVASEETLPPATDRHAILPSDDDETPRKRPRVFEQSLYRFLPQVSLRSPELTAYTDTPSLTSALHLITSRRSVRSSQGACISTSRPTSLSPSRRTHNTQ